jgi:hypothetical protein
LEEYKMKKYVKCLDYEKNDCFPYLNSGEFCQYYECDETLYDYWQPESIENDEFNTIILINGSPVKVRGIHFEFGEVFSEILCT